MSENNGTWLKFYRKIWDNPRMCKPDYFTTFMYILSHVVYMPTDAIFRNERITLQPGQGIFTLAELGTAIHVSKPKMKRIVDVLKLCTQIETQTSNRNTLITVINWTRYQNFETQNETQVKRNRNATETPAKHLPLYKEFKNYKNDKNIPPIVPQAEKESYPQDKRLGEQKYADFVWMLPTEYDKLVMDLGQDGAAACIKILNDYKGSTGKKYANDYYAIQSWVKARYREDQKKKTGKAKTIYTPFARNDTAAGVEQAKELLGIKDGSGDG